jgi:hypothetical protein
MWRIVPVALAVAALVLPAPSAVVERLYSRAVFPALQSALTSASNATPFAWFDLLVVLAAVGVAVLSMRDLYRASVGRAAFRIARRLVTVASIAYLAFLVTWGLNYRRPSMRDRVSYAPARVSPEAAAALGRETVASLNSLYGAAHTEGWPEPLRIDRRLADAFAAASNRLGLRPTTAVGRPKHSAFDLYFRRVGIAGMTDPYFLETLVASDLLPFERPAVVAHEWGHLAGLTDEGEANFLGWLTCLRSSTAHQYSGWLFLYGEVLDRLPRDTARSLSSQLASGPRSDLAAVRQRYEREVSPRLAEAGWQAYDGYLKANRVEAGTQSYAEVVQLILGTGIR